MAWCLELGVEDYGEMLALQHELVKARKKGAIPDTLIVLEHSPCYTIGRKGGAEHLLASSEVLSHKGVRVFETDRGGDITYHGPGQVVCYPILDLSDHGRDVHLMARRLEEVLIRTLKRFAIDAHRREGFPGVWVHERKIGFMGLSVESWITCHGVSLNVSPDLNLFSWIVPCGITGCVVTSMAQELGTPVATPAVRRAVIEEFGSVFGMELVPVTRAEMKVLDYAG